MPVNSAAFMPCGELIYSYRLFSIGKIILEPLAMPFVKVKVYYNYYTVSLFQGDSRRKYCLLIDL